MITFYYQELSIQDMFFSYIEQNLLCVLFCDKTNTTSVDLIVRYFSYLRQCDGWLNILLFYKNRNQDRVIDDITRYYLFSSTPRFCAPLLLLYQISLYFLLGELFASFFGARPDAGTAFGLKTVGLELLSSVFALFR